MRIVSKSIIGIIGLCFMTSISVAKDIEESAIDARQGEMQLRSFNAGPLFAMAKGDMAYDAEMAAKLANNLKILLSLDNGRAWMQGTSTEDYPDKTRALPAVWKSDSEIGDRGKAYVDAVNALAASAGEGLDALTTGVKDLGRACKGCHDDYREED